MVSIIKVKLANQTHLVLCGKVPRRKSLLTKPPRCVFFFVFVFFPPTPSSHQTTNIISSVASSPSSSTSCSIYDFPTVSSHVDWIQGKGQKKKKKTMLWVFWGFFSCCCFKKIYFPHWHVSKMLLVIFVNDAVSWIAKWQHWPAIQWHADFWHHIFGLSWINPILAIRWEGEGSAGESLSGFMVIGLSVLKTIIYASAEQCLQWCAATDTVVCSSTVSWTGRATWRQCTVIRDKDGFIP